MNDLIQIIGEDALSAPGYCNTDLRNPGPYYWDWEQATAIPRLQKLGYTIVGKFQDGERDSFGPLTRYIRVLGANPHCNCLCHEGGKTWCIHCRTDHSVELIYG